MRGYVARFIVLIDWDEVHELELLPLVRRQMIAPNFECSFGSRYEAKPSRGVWKPRSADLNKLFTRPTLQDPNYRNAMLKSYIDREFVRSIRVTKEKSAETGKNGALLKVVLGGKEVIGVEAEDTVEEEYRHWDFFVREVGLSDVSYYRAGVFFAKRR